MGLFLMLLGAEAGIFVIINPLAPPEASAGSVLLSVAPLLVGIQMLLYALMLDIQGSPDSPMTIDYRRMAEAASTATPGRRPAIGGTVLDGASPPTTVTITGSPATPAVAEGSGTGAHERARPGA